MYSSTSLQEILSTLTQRARALGLTDSAWAARAAMPKETLSRLRRRTSCDFSSLASLAQAVDMRLTPLDARGSQPASGGNFPAVVDRAYEARLVELCASRDMDPDRWASCGPRFFMAGLAVMLASVRGFDRRALLALAEELHPGCSEPVVFERWLELSPVRPSRFLPMVNAFASRAA